MKTKHYTVLMSLVFSASVMATDLSCLVIGVSDGDTIRCLDSAKQQHRIRFDGIDAPESKQAFGQKAKQALSNLIYRQPVVVKVKGQDQYGREIGTVFLGNQNINQHMVVNGYAWAYRQYSSRYIPVEILAKAQKRGLWRDPNPIEPASFRHQKKGS